ncbi:molybdenum cofactor biosynthesis protein [Sporosarcina sp. P37]|uniref:MogA/MoaB family molybdenum cofactor biosynthesis protein n=1 Tax=unclassified Sporosarcina TaxID=2647733 RepID=UPI000A17B519|nr:MULTISPECIES: MogA/MoaB family molybdenum cofactor biosynthesis protein [unclassified Sporosarcina]ARK25193.1 molybdenum cofactor biosynthesis protein [Sporosarcina sp. P37]PID17490.1 molybdenum cofactor biosynthesis protein [Sporosarcina sp. P35]
MEEAHLPQKARRKSIAVAVLTISDTRTKADDKSGKIIREKLLDAGHEVKDYEICADEGGHIEEQLSKWLSDSSVDAMIFTGGTGIGARDITVETVTPHFTKPLDGFGELFRFLSYTEDVGSKALLSRAAAGTIGLQAVFLLPGSSKAVTLAMDKLIVPELPHIVHELRKHLET